MAHINKNPGDHDFTASAFIVRTDFDEPKVMLHVHKKLGRYMQFGGHVDPPLNLWQALEMEIKEESGYEMSQLKLLQPHDRILKLTGAVAHPLPICINTHPFKGPKSDVEDHSHTDIEYAFVTDEKPKHEVGEDESHDFALFTRDEIEALDSDKIFENFREIVLFMFDVCLVKWEQVATSEVQVK